MFGAGMIGFDPTLGEPEPRPGAVVREATAGRGGGMVAEEMVAAQGTSQVVLEGDLVNLGERGWAGMVWCTLQGRGGDSCCLPSVS